MEVISTLNLDGQAGFGGWCSVDLCLDRDALCGGLQAVVGVAPLRPTMPILGNVLLDATGDGLTMTTTDLDFGVRCTVAADVKSAGRTTLPVRKLAAIVRAMQEKTLFLASTGGAVKISGGGSIFRMASLPVDDFPELPMPAEGSVAVALDAEEFLSLLRLVDYAQSGDADRHILNGIHCRLEGNEMTFVATDGRRLAAVSRPDSPGTGSLTIPARAVATLETLLSGGTTATLSFSARQVAFSISYATEEKSLATPRSVYLVSKLVDGVFPNYRQVIPGSANYRVRLSREALLKALQRVSLVSSGTAPSVLLRFSPNLLELSASSSEYGEAHERLAVPFPEGEVLEIAFNPRYLIDPLRAVPEEEIFFELRDGLSPGVFRRNDSFLCVVMPLRTGAE
ncbi:MAG: DNA polymerase III subunit beta [Puniceicoccales bacterium]|jgi:DNA polymerase-3 subunit beta|nr:DNA polymerase III subunit beta [Puniceicoccales bacterium]